MKMKRFTFLLVLLLAVGTILAACGQGGNETSKEESNEGSNEGAVAEGGNEESGIFKVAMVTDTGGVDDKSFNQSAWEGLTQFGGDFELEEGVGFKYAQSNSPSDYLPNLNTLVRDDYNLVYGIGFLLADDVKKIAQQKPEAQLAIVDSVITDDSGNTIDNIANITFKEHQGSFLVGVVAGLQTETNKVGFVGGVEGELIKKFENGFKAGVKAVNPSAEIVVQYAEDFGAPEKGQAIANTMYGNGADIIYHASGGTGNGVFTEAKNRAKNGEKVWVIGVDRDQHEEGMPENVTLTSMVKRVDVAVYDVSKQTMEGNFPGGELLQFGLEEDAVGIAPSQENVTDESLQKVEEFKEKILNGEIEVPTTDEEYESYLSAL
ncbi:BMP family lipoprotein [Bacillus solimangrovi]|uniref:BMP family ABC transporter substrate-binding protein n=1 Tax=Bacillus solimangrovi TaxID=1305675 RepID=A0A1E5LJ76_9BACI|nr:BMP family ABC transporter substrate-binding protein [Bacillus solimangrovi]OEH94149.1 BMP family ABC transporter substrate-binding protein [Bacillus solimangrovi]